MLRRFVSSLLILGYVASQLAAMPHAHGAGTAAEHAEVAVPHFHCNWETHDHDHADEHHHHHGTADHSPATCSCDESNAEELAEAQIGLKDTDHDSDAIYLPGGSASVLRGDKAQTNSDLAGLESSALPAQTLLAHVDAWTSLIASASFSSDGSGLYLTLRTLRL